MKILAEAPYMEKETCLFLLEFDLAVFVLAYFFTFYFFNLFFFR